MDYQTPNEAVDEAFGFVVFLTKQTQNPANRLALGLVNQTGNRVSTKYR